jgi:2'-hydroxyisoflavone reductase
LADHLSVARSVAGHAGPVVPAAPGWLTEHEVGSWMGPTSLPLWLDDADWHGMNARSNARARTAGLVTRPLEETLADTLVWEDSRPHPGPHGAGLSDEEERRLLALLADGSQRS